MQDFRGRFIIAAILLVTLLSVGSVGYMTIEGWSFQDAVYMSAITLTAVGYSEVLPLTPNGRLFTMGLLASGITWMGLWFALLTSFLVELDLTQALRRRRMMKRIENLRGHIIVCGAGRTGRQVIHELSDLGAEWVVVERNSEHIAEIMEHHPNGLVIHQDATHDETLLQAGLERARGLVSCLSADTDNLFVCLSARDLSPELTIVARALEEETMDKLYRAGATHVVSPNVSGAVRMASVLLRPSVVSFLDIATRSSDLALRMEQLQLETDSSVAGKTLAQARLPQATGLIVIALKKRGDREGHFVFNPVADTELDPGDELIVLGTQEQIENLRNYVA